jgi:hypothetical protein
MNAGYALGEADTRALLTEGKRKREDVSRGPQAD